MADIILFKSGDLEISRDENCNYRTIGSERRIACELAELFSEQERELVELRSCVANARSILEKERQPVGNVKRALNILKMA